MRDLERLLVDVPQPFTAAEAAGAGLSRHVLARGTRRGTLVRLAPGVYCHEPVWRAAGRDKRHLMLTAVVLRHTRGAVASHHSAAASFGLPLPVDPPRWVAITLAAGHLTSRPHSLARWHDGDLPVRQILDLAGQPVCSPDRVVIDCFRQLRLPDAVAIGDAALRRGLVETRALAAMRRWQRHWPGVAKADRGIRLLDARRETWLESWSFARLWELGVPPPTPQVSVYDARGRFVGRVDGLWRDQATVAEADGAGKYLGAFDPDGPSGEGAARRVLAEKEREDRLRDCGLEVVRWSWVQLRRDPARVVERIDAARARGNPSRFSGRFA
jgi:hypothetical protein